MVSDQEIDNYIFKLEIPFTNFEKKSQIHKVSLWSHHGHQCAMDDWHLNETLVRFHLSSSLTLTLFSTCVLKKVHNLCTYSALCFVICLYCHPFLTSSVHFKSILLILMKYICLVYAFYAPSIMAATRDTSIRHTRFPWCVLSHGKDMQKKSFQ